MSCLVFGLVACTKPEPSEPVVMSRGFIQQIGTPEEVYQDPANIFVAKFIGSPSMNVFNIDYDTESGCLERNDVKIPLKAEFKKRHDEFYATAVDKFEGLQSNFDEKAREEILKKSGRTYCRK